VERSREVDRLLAFSDAVVAIAATLLVLPLVDVAVDIDSQPPGPVLADHAGDLLAFGLSFVVIYQFWLVHHAIYEPVVRYTPLLAWLNGLWLLSIVFLPFPTQLIGSASPREALTHGLYVGTLLVTTAANTLVHWVINANPEVRAPGAPARSMGPSLVQLAGMATVFVVTVAVPSWGVWPLLLLVPAGWVAARLGRSSGQ
jgi:uncharacterized membrane protein